MKQPIILAVMLSTVVLTGCVSVRPKADTVLWFTPGSSHELICATGSVSNIQWKPGKTLRLSLRDVQMHTPETGEMFIVSGRLKAKPASSDSVQRQLDGLKASLEAWQSKEQKVTPQPGRTSSSDGYIEDMKPLAILSASVLL